MNKIVLYTKTFSRDIESVSRLIDSVKKHNKDNIPFYISVPKNEKSLFESKLDTKYIRLLNDEDIVPIDEQNWFTQQIVKSSFWKTEVCENYVMIDSDSYFIRDFFVKDFMYDDLTPYTVMHEQKDLFEWTSRYKEYIGFDPKDGFSGDRKRIMEMFQREGRLYDFGPSPTIWSSRVWKDLEENQLKPQGITLFDLIGTVPSEFTWYGEYLLKTRPIDIVPVGPLFKVFHYPSQYQFYKESGYTEEMLSQNYMGIVLQSNFSRSSKY